MLLWFEDLLLCMQCQCRGLPWYFVGWFDSWLVGPSVNWSVGQLVCLSVSLSVGWCVSRFVVLSHGLFPGAFRVPCASGYTEAPVGDHKYCNYSNDDTLIPAGPACKR